MAEKGKEKKTPLRNEGSWSSPALAGTESLEARCLLPCRASTALGPASLDGCFRIVPGLSTLSQTFKEVGAKERRLSFLSEEKFLSVGK